MAVNMIEGLLDQEPAILIYLLGTALNNYNASEADQDEFVEVRVAKFAVSPLANASCFQFVAISERFKLPTNEPGS